MLDYVLLAIAAFLAGIVNTIAGGGTFLTFPALVMAGVPPVMANATSAIAVFPGYLLGAVGFSRELKAFSRPQIVRLVAISMAGGLTGALLLAVSSDAAFSIVVPFLLLLATLIFAFSASIGKFAGEHSRAVRPEGAVGLFVVTIYGGYFGGGLGIVLLALFTLWGMTDLHRMNGLKNVLSFAIASIAVGVFAVGGLIAWPEGIAMMAASGAGGYLGAPLSRALPQRVVRFAVVGIGFGMSLVFFLRLFT